VEKDPSRSEKDGEVLCAEENRGEAKARQEGEGIRSLFKIAERDDKNSGIPEFLFDFFNKNAILCLVRNTIQIEESEESWTLWVLGVLFLIIIPLAFLMRRPMVPEKKSRH
jgi:hypothetical protein